MGGQRLCIGVDRVPIGQRGRYYDGVNQALDVALATRCLDDETALLHVVAYAREVCIRRPEIDPP